jgi:hypothetical protein
MTRYFRMLDDVTVPGRWFLCDPVDGKGNDLWWCFSEGKPVQVERPVRVHFNAHAKRGSPIDYCELDGDPVPVVHVRVASMLAELASSDVQLIPVGLEGFPDQLCILNVTRVIDCIDDAASEYVKRYTPGDAEVFADKVGEYSSVRGLRIDRERVGDARIFRTWGWIAIIVSAEIKEALERLGTTGVRFEEV